MEKEIEMKYVEETLNRYGARLQGILVKSITSRKLISDKPQGAHLKDSITYEISKKGHFGYELKLYFPDYGRFLEIRYHMKPPGKGKMSDETFGKKKLSSGIHSSKSKLEKVFASRPTRTFINPGRPRIRDTRWYAKPAYSSLNRLIGELMYGLSESVQDTLRNQLNEPL
jgi:hypothetical protein